MREKGIRGKETESYYSCLCLSLSRLRQSEPPALRVKSSIFLFFIFYSYLFLRLFSATISSLRGLLCLRNFKFPHLLRSVVVCNFIVVLHTVTTMYCMVNCDVPLVLCVRAWHPYRCLKVLNWIH